MELDITKEVCMKMAEIEGDSEIGAGLLSLNSTAASYRELSEKYEAVKSELEALRAQMERGVRMFACVPPGNTQTILAANLTSKANATLIFDVGVEI